MIQQYKFKLGRVILSEGVKALCNELSDNIVKPLLQNHANGVWGDLTDDEKQLNDLALKTNKKIFSLYKIDNITFFIITEDKRRFTSVTLSTDY